jgi:hypothetical protein
VKLRGKVIVVEADKLSFDVSESSNKQLYSKGTAIATAIGLGAGLAVAMPVNTYAHIEGDGAPLAVAAIVIVPAVLGFLAGRSADMKTVTVTVTD